ncbi:hypothetical protein [Methanobrevibacter sp.]|uniref:hypothetical protein n=1 Tax=Methanobrevibacter sp. TaxID=66852 RepID=UPI003868926C
MELVKYSLEWYKENLPPGVTINERLTKLANPGMIMVDIDTDEYPTLLSQMGIINYIELGLVTQAIDMNYSIDKFQYMSAYKFRKEHGYDNKFFEV